MIRLLKQEIHTMTHTVRFAAPDDFQWINAQYAEINFLPSNIDTDRVAIAEVKAQRAGLGRVVKISDQAVELGGMYVLPAFRKLGLARQIVRFLLAQTPPAQTVYCLPFEHLAPFYKSFGFQPTHAAHTPEEIRTKWLWCNNQYPKQVLLLSLESK